MHISEQLSAPFIWRVWTETPSHALSPVALTNLEDVDNATRAYEQAAIIDEWVCLTNLNVCESLNWII